MTTRYTSLFAKAFRGAAIVFVTVFAGGQSEVFEGLVGVLGGDVTLSAYGTTLLALVSGAGFAALRSLLGYFTNVIPGDEIHGPNADSSVTIAAK